MRINFHAAARWMAAVACTLAITAAAAQSPAVNKTEANDAKQQQAQQQVQPFNNQPVWSEVRSGQPQYTSIPGRETNVLIQPQGQTWRALRVPVATIGGFLFAAALVVLALFYLWRGPIRVRGAR
jgi:formate dehydrogenase subunit gamma